MIDPTNTCLFNKTESFSGDLPDVVDKNSPVSRLRRIQHVPLYLSFLCEIQAACFGRKPSERWPLPFQRVPGQ